MARKIKTFRGHVIRWENGHAAYASQNARFLRALSGADEVGLLVTLDRYHAIVKVGNQRMPLPVLGKLIGFFSYESDFDSVADVARTEKFLRANWQVIEKPRAEVVRGSDDFGISNVRVWGQRAGILWHVFGTDDRPMESGSVTIWAGDHEMSVSAEWLEEEVDGSVPRELVEATGINPDDPDGFFDFLVALGVPADDLNEVWPAG